MRVPTPRNPSNFLRPGPVRALWAAVGVLSVLLLAPSPLPALDESWVGRPLSEALETLRADGLELVYNSRVVEPEMEVLAPAAGDDPVEILASLLAPHGLVARPGPGGRWVILPRSAVAGRRIEGRVLDAESGAPLAEAVVRAGEAEARTDAEGRFILDFAAEGDVELRAAAPGYREGRLLRSAAQEGPAVFRLRLLYVYRDVVVVPSQITLRRAAAAVQPITLSKDLALALPGLSDDPVRGLTVAPGITAADGSARLSVRGSPEDGTQILFDGIELFEPYHLQDFGGASSILAPEIVESIDVMTGTAPARYGGRSGGVIEMQSLIPRQGERRRLGVGLLDSHLLWSGDLGDGEAAADRGYWLALARVGTFDPALRFDGRRDRPSYWDLFTKLETRFRDHRSLTSRVLVADDHVAFRNSSVPVREELRTRYRSAYAWTTFSTPLDRDLWSETTGAYAQLSRNRRASEQTADLDFDLDDQRRLHQVRLEQLWRYRRSDSLSLTGGIGGRYYDAHFEYRSALDNRQPLAAIRTGSGAGSFVGTLEEDQFDAHLSALYQPTAGWTVEIGARLETYSLTRRKDVTPRIALAYRLGDGHLLRASWGSFVQNQRPYELQVTDGETEFALGDRSEQAVVGYERSLGGARTLRVEAYQRTTSNPRARYVNLYEPRTAVPEVQSDRLRLAASRSEAEGVEVFLGSAGPRRSWWLHYAAARSRNRLEGGWIPAPRDQRHSVSAQIEQRIRKRWTVAAVWRYHSGWPTTRLSAEGRLAADGTVEITPTLGPLFGDRLPAYHRLDLRIGRRWGLSRGRLDGFVEIQNLYGRDNVRGYELTFLATPPAGAEPGDRFAVEVGREEESWRGFFASCGISWTF